MKRAVFLYLSVVVLAVLAACAVGPSEDRLTGSDHWWDAKVKPWK